jgi:hypothetical protein
MTKRTIDRVAARPDPAMWRNDELLTLGEAARLVFPNLLSERSLRHAAKIGRLPISVVNGKHFTTLDALALLSVCTSLPASDAPDNDYTDDPDAEDSDLDEDLAAIRRIRDRR